MTDEEELEELAKLSEKLFPTTWKGTTLTSEDVNYYLGKNKKFPAYVTKSVLGQNKWDHNQLQHLISTKGKAFDENWNLSEGELYLLVWQKNRSIISSPDAIMSFDLSVYAKTKRNEVSWVSLFTDLIWVDPESRGKGLGAHLVGHFLCYLRKCKVYPPVVAKNGVDINFYAEFHSEGGERLSNYIHNGLRYMRDSWKTEPLNGLWAIKKIKFDGDY